MSWRYKVRSLFSRNLDRDLEDELRAHLEFRTEQLRRQGVAPAEAEAQARSQFGNLTVTRERTREQHVFQTLETFGQDLVYAWRILTRQKAFTLTALLTLALGIGANGAIFSLIEAVLLRPLPFPQADRLCVLFGTDPASKRDSISPVDLEDWRKASSFTSIAAGQGQSVNLTGVEQPTRVIGGFVSPEYFPVLGIPPALGRTFAPDEDQPGKASVVVLGHTFWQDRLGADPAVLGRTLILNGEPATVIGVMPASFQPPFFVADLWLPSHLYPNYSRDRMHTAVLGIARLAPGASMASAQAELNTITSRLAKAYPESNHDRGGVLVSFRDILTQNLRTSLFALGAASGCLLLIVCANISGLLLAKASARRQELAIRFALGAARARIIRQLLTESILLSVIGAALGIVVAIGLAQWLSQNLFDWPVGIQVQLNLPVMTFLVIITLVAGILFGLAPAFLARRSDTLALRERRTDLGRAGLRRFLVVGQVAAAFVLLAAAGLLAQSLRHVLAIDPGFDGRRVLSLEYRLPRNKYTVSGQQIRFHEEVLERVRSLAGVEAAGIVGGLPFSGNENTDEIRLPDRPPAPKNAPFLASTNLATPGYFETVGIPLKAGRLFRESDNASGAPVALVSDSFVKRYWPGVASARDVIGRLLLLPDGNQGGRPVFVPETIVGVVGDVKENALDLADLPQVYRPYAQHPSIFATLAVRTAGAPLARSKDVQRAIWSIDKDQPMWKIRTLQYLVDRTNTGRELLLILLTAFSGLALLLSALGLYGLISYQVSQRTAEFGVRIAVGARPGDILSLVFQQGLTLALAGLAIGMVVSPALGRILQGQLFGVGLIELSVYVPLAFGIAVVSLIAAGLPAWRATQIDPVQALRGE